MLPRTRRAVAAAGATALAGVATLVVVPPASAGVSHDASVTVTDSATEAVAGGTTTYSIVVSNAGPSATSGGLVVSSTFTPGDWTCAGAGGGTCPASGSGDISGVTVGLPIGATATFTVPVDVPSDAAGGSTASVQATYSTVGDVDEANDSAQDDDTITLEADLAITKTDNVTTRSPGQAVTYTIDVTNNGPSDTAANVADTFPAAITGNSWNCAAQTGAPTCTASGSGDIDDDVTLPAGSTIRYSTFGFLAQGSTGSVSNTATVTAAVGTTDDTPGNDSATDTDTVAAIADLAATIDDGVTAVTPGGGVTYIVVVANNGPADTTGTVSLPVPAGVHGMTWFCGTKTGSPTCTPSGTGAVNDAVTLPSGSSVQYTVSATVDDTAAGSIIATVTATSTGGTEADGSDNSATDTDSVSDLLADLSVTKDGDEVVVAGDTITYDLTVANAGPDDALDVVLTDELPAGTTFVSLTDESGVPFDASTAPAVGANGTVTVTWDVLPSGGDGVVRLTVDTSDNLPPGTEIENVATVASLDTDADTVQAEATVDPAPLNNTDSLTTTVLADADLSVTKALTGQLVSGANATYTLTVRNSGPDATDGTMVAIDALPSGLTFVSASGTGWTCEHDAEENAVVCFRDASLPNGGSSTITVVTRVTAAAGTRLVNDAAVLSNSFDNDQTNNFAEVSASVAASSTTASAGSLPRTGGPVAALVRLALIAFGLGLLAFSTGSLNLLRQLPVRRRDR